MRTENPLKKALASGRVVVGTFQRIPSPALTELMMNAAPFDYLIIDTEHGTMSLETAEQLVRAAETSGVVTFIRVSENDPSLIGKALDSGSLGVLIPHIKTREDAERAVSAAKFYPQGMRPYCPNVRAGGHWTPVPQRAEYTRIQNELTSVDLLIEDVEGVENFDEIIGVPGIDSLWLGPGDLSQSLGVPGEEDHPKVVEALERMAEKASRRGVTVSMTANSYDAMRRWVEKGVRNFVFGSDASWTYLAFRRNFNRLSEVLGPEWRGRNT